MLKIFLISILLTLAYSWNDCLQVARILFLTAINRNPGKFISSRVDRIIGTIILIATLPIVLTSFLASKGDLTMNLLKLAVALLALSTVAAGAGIFMRYARMAHRTKEGERWIPMTVGVAGLFSPLFGSLFNISALPRPALAHLAFWLSLPPLAGLAIKTTLNYSTLPEELLPNTDALIITLVGALTVRIIIEILEKIFLHLKIKSLMAFYRIAVGIILIFILQQGL